jgi:hypothetical protein
MKRRREWWSFQPLADGTPPVIADNDWSQHPIDLHILAALQEKSLAPTTDAAAGPLVRRLFFTVIGLPPTADEAMHWTARVSEPGGVEALVDHLLASPHFGEQWARHWMDWIRYADTHGSEGDPEIGGTWHYRNYLIRDARGKRVVRIGDDIPVHGILRSNELAASRAAAAAGISPAVLHADLVADVAGEAGDATEHAARLLARLALHLRVLGGLQVASVAHLVDRQVAGAGGGPVALGTGETRAGHAQRDMLRVVPRVEFRLPGRLWRHLGEQDGGTLHGEVRVGVVGLRSWRLGVLASSRPA